MALAAPALFSTTTGWPSLPESFSASTRAMESVPLPAANGTTSVIVRVGQVWAAAWGLRAARTQQRVANRNRLRIAIRYPLVPSSWTYSTRNADGGQCDTAARCAGRQCYARALEGSLLEVYSRSVVSIGVGIPR